MNGHVKPDEIRLMEFVLNRPGPQIACCPTEDEWAAVSPRWPYLLDKWDKRGWWMISVSIRTGWVTDKGRAEMPVVIEETKRRYIKMVTTQLAAADLIESAGFGTVQREMSGNGLAINIMLKPAAEVRIDLNIDLLAPEPSAPAPVKSVGAARMHIVRKHSEKLAEHYGLLAGAPAEIEAELPDIDEEDPLSNDAVQAYESSIAESLANMESNED